MAIERDNMNGKWLSLIIGILFDRETRRQRITERLKTRFDEGMIDEVAGIHAAGISWERLERLGLEYRFTAE